MTKNSRYQPVVSRNTDEYVSENHWLKRFEKTLQKGAVQPRTTESLYDQINSIMNGSKQSRYPSVQDAVNDMMHRSGLTNYLKTSKEKEDGSKKTASDDLTNKLTEDLKIALQSGNWSQAGKISAEIDKLSGEPRINGAESIRLIKYYNDPEIASIRVPLEAWEDYTNSYGEGLGLSPEEKLKDLEFTRGVLNNIRGKMKKAQAQQQDQIPDVIRENPAIRNTLQNYIKSTRGNLPIPAIIDKLRSIHRSDIAKDKMWEDEKLIRLVSQMNLEAKKNNPSSFQDYNNLAVGDRDNNDSDIDPSNTDAFNALMPAKL